MTFFSAKKSRLASALVSYRRKPNDECFTVTVDTVAPGGAEEVYDVQVPGINAFDANGIVVHNCGEQPLLPYEACCLGSINLGRFVTAERQVDWEKLRRVIKTAVRFLDNVIDASDYVIEEIAHMHKHGNRKIGLGVMGWHDLLVRLGLPYDSEEALQTGEQVMQFISAEAKKESAALAEERGVFPNFTGSIHDTGKKEDRVRNATRTTIAPTGTLSILAGCSSGVEPLYAVVFTRRILDGQQMLEVHPLFAEVARARGFYSEELMEKISQHKTLADIEEIPEDVRRVFKTAYDITPKEHICMQAAFQKHTDNAVSKTVNFRHEATREEIEKVYQLAWEMGCKGVTVYRDGSREYQVLSTGKADKAKAAEVALAEVGHNIAPRPRPMVTQGITERVETGCGSLFVTLNADEAGLCEIFLRMGRSGGCTHAQSEATGRLVSLALRSGIEPEEVSKQLKGIRCPVTKWSNGDVILSCADAIGKVLERNVSFAAAPHSNGNGNGNGEHNKALNATNLLGLCPECPDCGSILEIAEGCLTCRGCGYSKCA